ncbi:MAG: hypothetical protein ACLU37_03850 [Collinsella sp.]
MIEGDALVGIDAIFKTVYVEEAFVAARLPLASTAASFSELALTWLPSRC